MKEERNNYFNHLKNKDLEAYTNKSKDLPVDKKDDKAMEQALRIHHQSMVNERLQIVDNKRDFRKIGVISIAALLLLLGGIFITGSILNQDNTPTPVKEEVIFALTAEQNAATEFGGGDELIPFTFQFTASHQQAFPTIVTAFKNQEYNNAKVLIEEKMKADNKVQELLFLHLVADMLAIPAGNIDTKYHLSMVDSLRTSSFETDANWMKLYLHYLRQDKAAMTKVSKTLIKNNTRYADLARQLIAK